MFSTCYYLHAIVLLPLLLIFVRFRHLDASVRFTNLKCESYDETFAKFDVCKLSVLGRGKIAVNIYVSLLQTPVTNISVQFAILKKANGYHPFLYNATIDYCAFMVTKNRFPVLKTLYDIAAASLNVNHTCPYDTTNDYTYHNTISRRSQLGAYYHMNKQPSYTNEHSLNSQYGYNTWGIWRDGRNIAPSTFSAKTHTHYQKTRSFSIILTTAAFIVLLAVISIAGLAFYFSSIKANMEDPVLGFEGSFRIAKGDLFSTGLKYNHTTTYKQKIEFYKRFVERALMDNGLQPLRTDIWGFGEGPLIKVSFHIFLDVRKLPPNIHSVEEYIKESLFLETTATKSLYRSLRIDAESVEIKRILDEQIVKTASLFRDAPTPPTSQTQLEKRLMKNKANANSNTPPGLISKPLTTSKPKSASRPHSADDEPDVDVENAPVIQGSFEGSFEITKTDADIARKKIPPTKAYTSLPPKAVTPFALRVKPKKPSIEKLTTVVPLSQQPKSTTSTTSTTTTTTTTTSTTTTTTTTTPRPTTARTTTTTTTTTTPEPPPPPPPPSPTPSTTTSTTTTTTEAPSTTSTTTTSTNTPTPTATMGSDEDVATTTPRPPMKNTLLPNHFNYPSMTAPPTTLTVPKLDTNLFSSIPVLDTQPWRPIHREVSELLPGPPPAYPTKTLPSSLGGADALPSMSTSLTGTGIDNDNMMPPDVPHRRIDDEELPFIEDDAVPPVPAVANPYAPGFYGSTLRKPGVETTLPQDMLFYHSFGNPVFMPGADGIERLGIGAHVQPHPLPVPLIDDVVIPPFRPLHPTLGTSEKLPFNIDATGSDGKFEHLGGGVIVKKHDSSEDYGTDTTMPTMTTTMPTTTTGTGTTSLGTTSMKPPVVEQSTTTHKVDPVTANSELADSIGEFFMGLLNLTQENVRTTTQQPVQSRIEPDEHTTTAKPTPATFATSTTEIIPEEKTAPLETMTMTTTTTTKKPNFLNLKEIILKRNQMANQTKKFPSNAFVVSTTPRSTTTKPLSRTPISTTSTATVEATTKRIRIRPTYQKPPTILDDSSLFPSHSKWEFVNSSSTNNFGHTGNMRKVFNQTLQAWVSEDVDKTENLTLNDIKTRINNATNIQDISLIFDTLASKLGITPSVSTKVPPFSANKLKQTLKTTSASTTSTTTTTTISPLPALLHPQQHQQQEFIELPLQHREPFIRPMASFMTDEPESVSSVEGFGAALPVVGEAEVEVIDPNHYEEMLRSSQFAVSTTTETPPKLVTLLPVRSNSGIRTYRPLGEETQRSSSSSSVSSLGSAVAAVLSPGSTEARSIIKRKSNLKPARLSPPPEAVVKGGLKVKVK